MRWSESFIPTHKENPSDAECASHALLVRAGYVRQLGSGLFCKLPLAVRSTAKIERIIDDEMARIGGRRFAMPALHPAEPWVQSGRWDVLGEMLFRLKDRAGRDLCLGPTHEEIFALTASAELRSYRDLPQIWYQVQTKFRDEPRPRSGVIRTREFLMKDAYSFDVDENGLEESYGKHLDAYARIYRRCGLRDVFTVQAFSGTMGGTVSHEFMVATEAGESTVVKCACGYAANVDTARTVPSACTDEPAPDAPREVATPGARTVEEVSAQLDVPPARIIKSLVYVIKSSLVLLLVRGDDQLNEQKLSPLFGTGDLRPAHEARIEKKFGAGVGSLGPVGVTGVEIVADGALEGRQNMVCGANRDGYHLAGVTPGVHFEARFEDLRRAREGDRCAACDGVVEISPALELGHTFKLGTRYSDALGFTVLDADGRARPVVMGSYGIGIERILAAAVEQHHDEDSFVLPPGIAPYGLVITPISFGDEEQRAVAERLHDECAAQGIDVLLDDRDRRAGFKFKDADLIGAPLRVTVGPKGLPHGVVEFVNRLDGSRRDVPIDAIAATVRDALSAVPAA
ncbi:MAG: proline--tRNA ligase [Verrucomicrobia bacterium]|nr:proline--tRNA ligase [Verrucomicrobiota bacterium]